MAQTIGELSFTKDWRNPTDFPTYEGSEDQVRADMQYLPDEIRTYLNTIVVEAINTLVAEVAQLVQLSVPDGSITTVKLASLAATTEKIAAAAVTLEKMAAASVGTAQLVNASVTIEKMAAGSVGASQVLDGVLNTRHFVNGSVTDEKLGTDIVPTSVGFVVGEGDPMEDPSLIAPGQVYLKLESE